MKKEEFADGNTIFHQRDTRVKLIGALAINLVLAFSSSISTASFGLFICAILLFWSKPGLQLLAKRVLTVNIFTLFLWFTLPFTYNGDLFSGVVITTLITLKSNAILFCFLALIATSTAVNLGHALEKLGISQKLTFLLLFTYRQLFIIQGEYLRLQRAAKLRGFIPKNNLHTYRTYSHLFGMTLVKSWERAEKIQQAMILRGFTGKLLPLEQRTLQTADYSFLALLLLLSLLLAIIPCF